MSRSLQNLLAPFLLRICINIIHKLICTPTQSICKHFTVCTVNIDFISETHVVHTCFYFCLRALYPSDGGHRISCRLYSAHQCLTVFSKGMDFIWFILVSLHIKSHKIQFHLCTHAAALFTCFSNTLNRQLQEFSYFITGPNML